MNTKMMNGNATQKILRAPNIPLIMVNFGIKTIFKTTLFIVTAPIKLLLKKPLFKPKSKFSHITEKAKTEPTAAGYEFEEFIRQMCERNGYESYIAKDLKNKGDYPTDFLNGGGDGGMDNICFNQHEILLIQDKFYKSTIGKNIVAETEISARIFAKYFRSKGDKRQIKVYIITNNKFDNTAKAYAKETGISLIDGQDLEAILAKTA